MAIKLPQETDRRASIPASRRLRWVFQMESGGEVKSKPPKQQQIQKTGATERSWEMPRLFLEWGGFKSNKLTMLKPLSDMLHNYWMKFR